LDFAVQDAGAKLTPMPDALEREVDAHWMRRALQAAEAAGELGEVPIGACVVTNDNRLLAVAGNRTRTDCDPTAHAEILALRESARISGNYRLTGAAVYSTIEPCAMCAGALVQARVGRLIYGARDERYGAVETHFRICDSGSLNHRMLITPGVLEEECRHIMQEFFRARRTKTVIGN
jgi:tRNA(adenine34) deaminase